MVKAYFTQKCIQYFLEEKEIDSQIFQYLKMQWARILARKRSLRSICWLLPVTYAGQAEITADEKKQLQIMVNILLESEMVFPYMKDLGRFVSIPEDIMDKTMIEYRGDKNVQPWIEMRILPQEDHFTREEMKRVYQGIYVKKLTLFKGELLEYQIYERGEKGRCSCKRRPYLL